MKSEQRLAAGTLGHRGAASWAVGVLLLAVALASSALAQEDSPFAGLPEALESIPDISMFAEAFSSFDVASQLDPNSTYTIFAPTDASIEEAEFEFAGAEDVLAHIVMDKFEKAALAEMAEEVAGEPVTLESLAGNQIELALAQEGEVGLNGHVFIMSQDNDVGPALVHTVDGVLTVDPTQTSNN